MKLWINTTRVPNDALHYVVIGIGDEDVSNLLAASKTPLPGACKILSGYSVDGTLADARLYPRNPATDAALGALFPAEDYHDLDDVLDDQSYAGWCIPVDFDSFESLNHVLLLAGGPANPDWCYETYVMPITLSTNGTLFLPLGVLVSEDDGSERVVHLDIDLKPQPTTP